MTDQQRPVPMRGMRPAPTRGQSLTRRGARSASSTPPAPLRRGQGHDGSCGMKRRVHPTEQQLGYYRNTAHATATSCASSACRRSRRRNPWSRSKENLAGHRFAWLAGLHHRAAQAHRAADQSTARCGGASDAFHVVVPSMPCYGFSGKPTTTGWGPERIARAWDVLMKRLGYTRYAAQGATGVRSSST